LSRRRQFVEIDESWARCQSWSRVEYLPNVFAVAVSITRESKNRPAFIEGKYEVALLTDS